MTAPTPAETETAGKPCAGARCTHTLRDYELRAGLALCGGCGRAMGRWMREIPEQMHYLRRLREKGRTGTGGRTGTKTAPLPGDETVLNLLGPAAPCGALVDEAGDQHGPLPVHETLYRCMVVIRRARDLEGPRGNTAELLASWMEPHMEWVAMQTSGVEMQHTLSALMGTLRGVTRLYPRTYAVNRPCPRCEALTLYEQDHDDKIECDTCGTRYTNAEINDDAPKTLARLQRGMTPEEVEAVIEALA